MIDEVGREEMSMMNDVMHAASIEGARQRSEEKKKSEERVITQHQG
jgi:hypothetical protein